MTCQRIGSAIVCSRSSRPRPQRPRCHWPGCERAASQAGWGCRTHWFRLPLGIRNRLWLADRDDRAALGRRGPAWQACAEEADRWGAEQRARPPAPAWRQPELPL